MTPSSIPAGRLDSADALAAHLDALVNLDPRLAPVLKAAAPFEIRLQPGGFVGLSKVICGQQLSVASARAIWSRFAALDGALDPAGYLELSEETVRASGFSLSKFKTVRVVAEAVLSGQLDFDRLETLSPEAAAAELTTLKGIGPWTAELYLMFCSGHPDIFPAGDLALQKAVQHGLGLDAQPSIKELIDIAAAWSPYRHAAALLFWGYYASLKRREGVPL